MAGCDADASWACQSSGPPRRLPLSLPVLRKPLCCCTAPTHLLTASPAPQPVACVLPAAGHAPALLLLLGPCLCLCPLPCFVDDLLLFHLHHEAGGLQQVEHLQREDVSGATGRRQRVASSAAHASSSHSSVMTCMCPSPRLSLPVLADCREQLRTVAAAAAAQPALTSTVSRVMMAGPDTTLL